MARQGITRQMFLTASGINHELGLSRLRLQNLMEDLLLDLRTHSTDYFLYSNLTSVCS